MNDRRLVKNTENPAMLVFYLNKHRKEIKRIADAPKGTYTLTEFYRVVKPAFVEAPSKPYTNATINKYSATVRRGKASAESQARSIMYVLERNDELYGYGGGNRKPLEPKDIISDEELAMLETK
jgi:hypothetical protein